MSNPNKAKGDAGERAAVAILKELAPDLVSYKDPRRALGAGRKEDTGDIRVFHDTAIQVKNSKHPESFIRAAAEGADIQRKHKEAQEGHPVPFHLGMVKLPNARSGVVWLAAVLEYPDPEVVPIIAPSFVDVIKLVKLNPNVLFQVDAPGAPRTSKPPILVTALETWVEDYRYLRSQ